MKKTLKFLVFLLVVAILSLGASVLWSRNKNSDSAPISERFNGTAEYKPVQKGSIALTTETASFPMLIESRQEIRYYHSRTGEIKSVDLKKPGKAKLVAKIKPQATQISWSPDGTEIIATVGGSNTYVNLATGVSKQLAKTIINPSFSHDSNQVAYLYFNDTTGTGTISIADSQFKNFKNIVKTRLKNWEIQWNGPRRLSLIATSAETTMDSLYSTDTTDGGFDLLLDSKSSLKTNWAPDGKSLLYSRKTRKGIELFALDLDNRQSIPLGLSGTANKCAWTSDSSTLYCAITKDKDDSFIKISEVKSETLFTPVESGFVDARDLVYSPIRNALIFTNFKDGRLYELSLSR